MDHHSKDEKNESDHAKQEVRVLKSRDILGTDREVLIQHGNETYRLLHTKNGKLILQK